MGLDVQTIGVLGIVFLAMLVRGTFGFGDALVAMPLLAVVIGVKTAAPFMGLCGIAIAIAMLIRCRRDVRVGCAWRLVGGAAVGAPLGMLFLKGVYEPVVTCILGGVIIMFSAFRISRPRTLTLNSERTACAFGLLGGLLGGAYNTSGPPVVVYGTLKGWTPAEFRATLQGYFFPAGIFVVASHAAGGLWSREVFRLFLFSLPVIAVALPAGELLHRFIPEGKFDRYVHILLIAIGIFLVVHTVWVSG